MEKRYDLMLDEQYQSVCLYRSVGERYGAATPDKNGDIQGLYIRRSELSDPPPERLSMVVISD